jgi:hypothetical protein
LHFGKFFYHSEGSTHIPTRRAPVTKKVEGDTLTMQITCKSNINSLLGRCLYRNQCTGATLKSDDCKKETICCAPDAAIPIHYPPNKIISLRDYLILVGNSTRTRSLYTAFSKSIHDAGLTQCHQVAAYIANIQGETNNLMSFEETRDDFSKYDFDETLGNDKSNDGSNYKGRGARKKFFNLQPSYLKRYIFRLSNAPR